MNIKNFEEFQPVNERQERSFRQLMQQLEMAISAAERVGEHANMSPGEYAGWEGQEFTERLEELYAAFMTGDKNDKSYNNEIFKN